MSTHGIEYPDDFLNRLEIVWGKGFLSPGGAEEVTKIVEGVNIAGQTVLDFGCGTGGPALVLANGLKADNVIAIDVEEGVLARAKANAADAGAATSGSSNRVRCRCLRIPSMWFSARTR